MLVAVRAFSGNFREQRGPEAAYERVKKEKADEVGEILEWLDKHTNRLEEQGSAMLVRFLPGNASAK
jgi:hypothetical protein